ncbi:uncharacterized protein PAC_16558 [Phialocephala subalpina]|uniref:Ras-associating domain-containing protein n=1 Tax=Phialocephala subalpina TaxID=576137 RepID=A0A1L7XNX3_9HELO|nr:uncharacterized protein PAC_16558 [Phialocephala subalpina]
MQRYECQPKFARFPYIFQPNSSSSQNTIQSLLSPNSMEAIGAIASIIGVAGAGAKLSIVLFEFASTVGSAGQEVKRIGVEISLFCSVLKQLHSTLTKAKAYRYSLRALDTTQEILDQCQEVFKEIESILNGLRKGGVQGSAESSVDLVARVKWTFKRSQVQVLRATLESCKATLHLMLTTLEFAQKIATRRISTIETLAEDEHEGMMTRSLIIAQQCTVDNIQSLEEEEEEVQQQLSGSEMLSPPLTPGTPPVGRVMRIPAGHRYSRSFDNQTFRPPLPAKDLERKRASVWINDLMFDKSPLPADLQPYYFLKKWSDQGERLNNMRSEHVEQTPGQDKLADLVETDTASDVLQDISRNDSDTAFSQQENSARSPSNPDAMTASNGNVEIFKNIRITMGDPCYKVLPAALWKYNINAPWENYALHIAYGDKERCFGMEEKPLIIFKQLKKEGFKPMFVLRKIGPSTDAQADDGAKTGLDRSARRGVQATYNPPGGII